MVLNQVDILYFYHQGNRIVSKLGDGITFGSGQNLFTQKYLRILVYNYIKNSTTWNGKEYWELVAKINPTDNRIGLPWFYTIVKGIHPARFSYDFNMFLAKHAVNNKSALLDKQEYYLDTTYPTPYLCDNLFFSKTEFYVKSQELFFDHWDEGQVNMLSQQRGQTPAYVRNCYGIQPAYGCTKGQQEIEEYYIKNLFEKLV